MDALLMPMAVVLGAVGVAVIGVRLGMLLAPRLERLAEAEDEHEDAGDRHD